MAGSGVNKVILIGNLGQDPDVRQMSNGMAVANLNLATTTRWQDKNGGEKKEITEWHRVVLYRKLAEIAGEHLHKGDRVYIEGSLHTRKWQDKNGMDRYTTEIHTNSMEMLDSSGGGGSAILAAINKSTESYSLAEEQQTDFGVYQSMVDG